MDIEKFIRLFKAGSCDECWTGSLREVRAKEVPIKQGIEKDVNLCGFY